jgi:hypothetical protein
MPSLNEDHEGRRHLAEFLIQCFDSLNAYGKTPEQLGNLTKMFFAVLGEHPVEVIRAAFIKYLKTNSAMPTPADIENIINPPPPKIDWALYIVLKRRLRENVYVDQDEKKFLRECEQIGVDRMRGEVYNYQNAQRELERYDASRLEDYSE